MEEIVKELFYKLNHALLHIDKHLVGINSQLRKLNLKLSAGSDDAKFLGIYGLGGVGKTTIAKALYNRISYQFEGCSYLANVREASKNLVPLQEQLLFDILRVKDYVISNVDQGSYLIQNRLCKKMVLIILDDVDDITQLEILAGELNWFGRGSIIIVTTRNEQLLHAHSHSHQNDVVKYKVVELDPVKSLELFSWKAFKHNHPPEDYMDVSYDVVNYAKGLPLALKVLGSYLCGRSRATWRSALDSLKMNPNEKVTDVLKISYDGLEQAEKKIFLDIACFFKGCNKEEVTRMLENCGFSAVIGIEVLADRSLLTISDHNRLLMHDLVQEMGRYIVRQESLENPCKQSRLWLYENIRRVLINNAGTEAVEAIMLDLPRPDEDVWPRPDDVHLSLGSEAFKKMYNLRLLKIHNVDLPQGLSSLPADLRVLDWFGYPLKDLPSSFAAERLVELEMHWSCLEELWNGIKELKNLKSINLSWSGCLTKIPALERVPNLEQLILNNCSNLVKIHPSIGIHKRLKVLSLRGCENFTSLPYWIGMESLETLNLDGCLKLEKFPDIHETMVHLKYLNLRKTAIGELPSSIANLTGLLVLKLNSCKRLKSLPSSICRLNCLEELHIKGCSKLEELPENMGDLVSLKRLDASQIAIREAPLSIARLRKLEELSFSGYKGKPSWSWSLSISSLLWPVDLRLPSFSWLSSLTYLNLSGCNLSDIAIPHYLGGLSSLRELNLSENLFYQLSASIGQLSQLTTLYFEDCRLMRAVPVLPSSIEMIIANGCKSLELFSDLSTVFRSKSWIFRFANCLKLAGGMTDLVKLVQYQALKGKSKTFNIFLPGDDVPEWFSHQTLGSSVNIRLPPNWYNKNLLGFAVCVVAGGHVDHAIGFSETLRFQIVCMPNEQKGGTFCICSDKLFNSTKGANLQEFSFMYEKTLLCSHTVVAYISRACFHEYAEQTNSYNQMEASFWFSSTVERVKKCGIRLVYNDDK